MLVIPLLVQAQLVSENFTVEGASFNGKNTSLSGTTTNYTSEYESGNLYILPDSTSTSSLPVLRISTSGTRVNFPLINPNALFIPTLIGPESAPVRSVVTFFIQVVRSDGVPLDPSTVQVVVTVTGVNDSQPVVRYRGSGLYEATYLVVNAGKDTVVATVNGISVTQEVEGMNSGALILHTEPKSELLPLRANGLPVPLAPANSEDSPSVAPLQLTAINSGVGSVFQQVPVETLVADVPADLLSALTKWNPLLIFMSAVGALSGLIMIALSFSRIPFSYTEISNIVSSSTRHIFGLVTWQKRRRPWGVVYDSVTKEPLDPAYVQLFTTDNKVIQEAITDLDGRYGFLAPEGRYSLTVNKSNYIFPSTYRPLLGQDVLYSNLYYGEEFTVEDTVVRDVPMDPAGRDWNQEEKMRTNQTHFFRPIDVSIITLLDTVFYLGLVALSIQFFFAQSVVTGLLLSGYVVLLYLRIKGGKPILYGVLSKNNIPLAFAIIRILKSGYEVAHKVADGYGRYAVLVAPGNYTVRIEERLGQDTYHTVYEHNVSATAGIINKSLKI